MGPIDRIPWCEPGGCPRTAILYLAGRLPPLRERDLRLDLAKNLSFSDSLVGF